MNSELLFLALYIKTIMRNFTFIYGIMLGNGNSKLSFFSLYRKTITQNFSESTKAFNSENIVQVCLVSSKTHKVNKDFSNSVKEFRVTVFWYREINDTSECFSKVLLSSAEARALRVLDCLQQIREALRRRVPNYDLNLNTHELSLSPSDVK